MVRRTRFTPELTLLLACCRWPASPDAVRAAARAPIDWPAFRALLDRHGVVALAEQALRVAGLALPPDDAAALARAGAGQRARSQYIAVETARWAKRFVREGVECRFLKGAALAQLAYGDLTLKRSSDVDVLVAPDRVLDACDLLRQAGFTQAPPYAFDDASLARYWRWGKEVTFVNDRGVLIDLHIRLAENRWILADLAPSAPGQDVTIGGVAVPVFSDADMYSYLCYHGAAHGWSRVKWLADLNAFSATRDVTALHDGAVAHGLGPASQVAQQLCRRLLGRECDIASGPPATSFHFQVATACIRHRLGGSDIEPIALTHLGLILSRATMCCTIESLYDAIYLQWIQPHVRAQYSDRRALIFHLLRVPRFLASVPRRLSASRTEREDPSTCKPRIDA
jgi:hypothetical protein